MGMIITALGAAKIAAATIGTPIVLDKIVWGDASGVAYTPDGSETALVNQIHVTDIVSFEIPIDQPNIIKVTGLIEHAPTAFTLLEVGILDDDGDLIAIGNHPAQAIPASGGPYALEYSPRWYIAVSSTSAITVNVVTPNDWATEEWVIANFAPLGAYVESVTGENGIEVVGSATHRVVRAVKSWFDALYAPLNHTHNYAAVSHSHPNATQSAPGYMSAADKIKLDGLGYLGGTAFLNKVAQTVISSPSDYADILNISGAGRYLVIAQGLELETPVATPGSGRTVTEIRMQFGAGSTLYTGGSDYNGPASYFKLSDTVDDGIFPHGGMIKDSTGAMIYSNLCFLLVGLNSAAANTRVDALSTDLEDDLMRQMFFGPEGRVSSGSGGRMAATAENRIRIWVPGNKWTAGRFMVYAVAA